MPPDRAKVHVDPPAIPYDLTNVACVGALLTPTPFAGLGHDRNVDDCLACIAGGSSKNLVNDFNWGRAS
jgi:hypothetical protein